MDTLNLLTKTYTGENMVDISGDIEECISNSSVRQDENEFHRGIFKVTVEWISEE